MARKSTRQCPVCRSEGHNRGKKVYVDYDTALGSAITNSGRYGKPMRVYPCPRGYGFHTTSKDP